MKLFEDIERTFTGPADHNENTYDYYLRSARRDVSIIRDKLNDWFRYYPEAEKRELKSSFKKSFYDSFFELFLFQLFTKLGFEIVVHPKLPNSSKRPDFLLKKDKIELYAEAKIVKSKSQQQEALERKINEVYDQLNKLDSANFILSIQSFNLKSDRQPRTKDIIFQIESALGQLNADELINKLKINGHDSIPLITAENDDLQLVVKPMPVSESARQKIRRPIGSYPIETFWGGGEESLKDSISKKAKRYGNLDKPFLVCVNSLDERTSGTLDIDNAIWGSLAWSWSEDPNNRDEKWIRQRDGVFLDAKGGRLKNLSGVLVTKVSPHNISSSNYWLYEHPFSENKLDFDQLGLKRNRVVKGKIIQNIGDDLHEIFGISKDWLSK